MELRNSAVQRADHLPTPTVADLIFHYLEQLDTQYVFGIPGGSLEPFYSALARSAKRDQVVPIVARHESGAAFMADGYARETGKLGVCCATTGPGATNMLTGVASAYQDKIPLLVFTAQTALETFGRGAVQESSCTGIDTLAMYRSCTRYNSLVSHPSQLERKLIAAMRSALNSPKGPAHLSIPLSVLRMPYAAKPRFSVRHLLTSRRLTNEQAIEDLLQKLQQVERPVLVIGSGCAYSVGAVLELALMLAIPVVTTPQGKGLVSASHPLYYGVFGLAGHASARAVVQQSDLLMVAGTALDEQATAAWSDDILNHRLVHIDETDEHFHRSPEAQLHVLGDLSETFSRLVETGHKMLQKGQLRKLPAPPGAPAGPAPGPTPGPTPGHGRITLASEEKWLANSSPIKPQRLMYDLSRLFPPNTRFLADIGNSFLWAIHYLHPNDRRLSGLRERPAGNVRTSMGFASMGWSIGAAVGTALARPHDPVVCIVGDGSFLMSAQELTVAVEHRLPIIYVILNDGAYGTVKHGQRMTQAEPVAYSLPPVDFMQMATACGARGYRIDKPADFDDVDIEKLCKTGQPAVFDVHIDPEEVPPINSRLQALNMQ